MKLYKGISVLIYSSAMGISSLKVKRASYIIAIFFLKLKYINDFKS